MSYIGNTPTQQSFVPAVDYFSGNGSTPAFTLSRSVASSAQVVAVIENVPQSPVDAFTVSGNIITFTSAPPSGSNNIYVYYTTLNTQVMQPTDGSVGLRQLSGDLQNATYGYKNRIINGAMAIDQRNAGASVTANGGAFAVDRFSMSASGTGKGTIQQSSVAPAGFTKSLLFTSSAATTVASTDYYSLYQRIEGNNVADLGWGAAGASAVTVSFWVRSSLTGMFGASIINGGSNRGYPFSYTINAANTWEYKTVTIPGDVTGTWAKDSSNGMTLIFSLGMGSTFSGPAGAWAASDYESVTGATSVVGTNGATFYITGVQLEKGTTATSFDWRPYSTELAMCQRYYYGWSYTLNNGPQSQLINSTGTPGSGVNILFPQVMRAAPTCTGSFTAFASGSSAGAASFNGNYNGYSIVARAANQYSSTLDTFAASAEL